MIKENISLNLNSYSKNTILESVASLWCDFLLSHHFSEAELNIVCRYRQRVRNFGNVQEPTDFHFIERGVRPIEVCVDLLNEFVALQICLSLLPKVNQLLNRGLVRFDLDVVLVAIRAAKNADLTIVCKGSERCTWLTQSSTLTIVVKLGSKLFPSRICCCRVDPEQGLLSWRKFAELDLKGGPSYQIFKRFNDRLVKFELELTALWLWLHVFFGKKWHLG